MTLIAVGEVREAARRFGQEGARLEETARALPFGHEGWRGMAAELWQDRTHQLKMLTHKHSSRLQELAKATNQFADRVEEAQQSSRAAEGKADDARTSLKELVARPVPPNEERAALESAKRALKQDLAAAQLAQDRAESELKEHCGEYARAIRISLPQESRFWDPRDLAVLGKHIAVLTNSRLVWHGLSDGGKLFGRWLRLSTPDLFEFFEHRHRWVMKAKKIKLPGGAMRWIVPARMLKFVPWFAVVMDATQVYTGGGYTGWRGFTHRTLALGSATGAGYLVLVSSSAVSGVGAPVAVVAIIGFAGWSLGNWVYDNREMIKRVAMVPVRAARRGGRILRREAGELVGDIKRPFVLVGRGLRWRPWRRDMGHLIEHISWLYSMEGGR